MYNANMIDCKLLHRDDKPVNQNDFADRIQQLLYQLVRNYELCDQMCVAEHKVTASQAYTLLAIPEESDITMNELSEAMDLANSTMTRMVDHLLRKGIVQRRHDDEDRRVVRVGLTAEGRELRHTLEKERQRMYREVLSEIQEKERPVIISALENALRAIATVTKKCCS